MCAKYKQILENKKTDHISTEEKNKAWEKITKEVNATAVNTTHRSLDVLKRFYENRKREVRKIAAEEKKDIFGTGGGQSKHFKKDACHDIILSIMNSKTVYGLGNNNDGDYEEPQLRLPETNISKSKQTKSEIVEPENDIEIHYELNSNEEGEASWKKYIPTDLKKPVTINLQPAYEELQPQKRNHEEEKNDTPQTKRSKPVSVARCRPTLQVKALTRSEIAGKYDLLLDKRLKIAQYQEQKLEEELSTIQEERKLKVQLFKLQIEVEKEKLGQLLMKKTELSMYK